MRGFSLLSMIIWYRSLLIELFMEIIIVVVVIVVVVVVAIVVVVVVLRRNYPYIQYINLRQEQSQDQ